MKENKGRKSRDTVPLNENPAQFIGEWKILSRLLLITALETCLNSVRKSQTIKYKDDRKMRQNWRG